MEYLTTTEMFKEWHITARRIARLCSENHIDGVIKKGKTWLIPKETKKPEDGRIKIK
ncbi:MAG: DNA-binding protein [Candidatus Niameybacter stercoravium]|nr:DNA-binding protein [Candidatus Niameybacter stercoravium]